MVNEAFLVLGEGSASTEEIDAGMRLGANHPIGPLPLTDLTGLNVFLSVMDGYECELGVSKYRPAPLLRELVATGRLGRQPAHGVCIAIAERQPNSR
jgi:3-hydroxybutyryl-CoA dehydrogenase